VTFVVGLTGGIGSGKSAAADEFARLGATVVDTDAIARELTERGGAALPHIKSLFGDAFVTSGGAMDRDAMRSHVFSDPAAKQALEGLLHPLIRARWRPMQVCSPAAKEMCGRRFRNMSNSSERSHRRSSRLAEPMHTSITDPAGSSTPSTTVSSITYRCTVVSGVSNRKPSSIAADISS